MAKRNDGRLRFRPEIDQQVTAGDEIDVGERWIAENVLDSKNDDGPKLRNNAVAAPIRYEEALQPLGRNLRLDRLGIDSIPGEGDCAFVGV